MRRKVGCSLKQELEKLLLLSIDKKYDFRDYFGEVARRNQTPEHLKSALGKFSVMELSESDGTLEVLSIHRNNDDIWEDKISLHVEKDPRDEKSRIVLDSPRFTITDSDNNHYIHAPIHKIWIEKGKIASLEIDLAEYPDIQKGNMQDSFGYPGGSCLMRSGVISSERPEVFLLFYLSPNILKLLS